MNTGMIRTYNPPPPERFALSPTPGYGEPSQAAKNRFAEAAACIPPHHQEMLRKHVHYYALRHGKEDPIGSGIFNLTVDPKMDSTLAPVAKEMRKTMLMGDSSGVKEDIGAQMYDIAYKLSNHQVSWTGLPLDGPEKELSVFVEETCGFQRGSDLHLWFLRQIKRFNDEVKVISGKRAAALSTIPEHKLGKAIVSPGQTLLHPNCCQVNEGFASSEALSREPVLVPFEIRNHNHDWRSGHLNIIGNVAGFHNRAFKAIILRDAEAEGFNSKYMIIHETGHDLKDILFEISTEKHEALCSAAIVGYRKVSRREGLAKFMNPKYHDILLRNLARLPAEEMVAYTYELIHSNSDSIPLLAQYDPDWWNAFQVIENLGRAGPSEPQKR